MNIGLIAMSGLRACDPELLALGLTLPGFVDRGRRIAQLPSLGLLTLAGMTPAHHRIRYLEVPDADAIEHLPMDFDLVAISSFSAQIGEAYRVAQRYRSAGIPVVIGGLHVTAAPEEAVQHGANPVVGEGEPVWARILEDAGAGTLAPIYDARGIEFDLRFSPMPAFELLDAERYNRITVQTSRGCPWRCDFCASSILLTERYKQKPVDRVLAEIDRIRALWPRPFIEFADDNSFVNKRYWRKLLPELERFGLKWFAETDVSVHEDPELLDMMRAAGCVEVLIGFESPTRSGLEGIELRRNWKLRQFDQYRTAIDRVQSAGIRVNACLVVGLDGQGPGVFDDIRDFVDETLPFDVQVTLPTPFPGTPFHERLRCAGRLRHEAAWERCTLFDLNFTPDGMSAEMLVSGFRRLVTDLYSIEATRKRRIHFHRLTRRRPGSIALLGESEVQLGELVPRLGAGEVVVE
jgi:radical SAM superfamily enzyme YgiQ (UPF0313 family)